METLIDVGPLFFEKTKMKAFLIAGTRPNFIKIAAIFSILGFGMNYLSEILSADSKKNNLEGKRA